MTCKVCGHPADDHKMQGGTALCWECPPPTRVCTPQRSAVTPQPRDHATPGLVLATLVHRVLARHRPYERCPECPPRPEPGKGGQP